MSPIKDQIILVTGAAGSIGSVLCEYLLNRGARVVAFDNNELGLFNLKRQLSAHRFGRFAAVLGDVTRVEDVRHTVDLHEPDTIIHAAAYKHVGMCEDNAFVARRVNVSGTKIVIEEARQIGSKFVLVSTDKAVRPSCVMGESKQQAEQITRMHGGVVIRMGNVVGSSGSVLQVWEAQAAAGKLITVSDAEATRYFIEPWMAVEAITAVAEHGLPGNVYVPNMGEPVNILQLAIQRGARQIDITGLSPGEKKHEELFVNKEPVPLVPLGPCTWLYWDQHDIC